MRELFATVPGAGSTPGSSTIASENATAGGHRPLPDVVIGPLCADGHPRTGRRDHALCLVPVIDVNWLTFAPFDPGRGFRVDPPKVKQTLSETAELCERLKVLIDGRFVLTPHSGTYCRAAFYQDEFLDLYRRAVADGAEIAVHLHEEIKGAGTHFGDEDHMRLVFHDCERRLGEAGISPTCYRGGHSAYAPFMNQILEESGIFIDLSCVPGMNEPAREAIWINGALSGYYLPADPRATAETNRSSSIFEIPMGSDGAGATYRNILHTEQSDLDNLIRIHGQILARAERTGRTQFVQCLFHTGSVSCPEWFDRFRRFLSYAMANDTVIATPSVAKRRYDALHDGLAETARDSIAHPPERERS